MGGTGAAVAAGASNAPRITTPVMAAAITPRSLTIRMLPPTAVVRGAVSYPTSR